MSFHRLKERLAIMFELCLEPCRISFLNYLAHLFEASSYLRLARVTCRKITIINEEEFHFVHSFESWHLAALL